MLQFREALMDAFRSESELKIMLNDELGWKLNAIAGGNNYTEIVDSLISYVESKNLVKELLEAAKKVNPGNFKLKNFADIHYNTNTDKSHQLYQALMSLNYKKQVDIFEKYWQMSPQPKVGCFLVSGESGNGQKWLVNKLLHLNLLPDTTTAKKVSVSLKYEEQYIEYIWSKLSRELNSSIISTKELEKLVKLFYKHWQTKTVIIVIHNLEFIQEEREKIIKNFWHPLVEKIHQHSQPCNSHLIMFLVDNEGCMSDWQLDFNDDLNKYQISQPIAMEPLETFSKDILNSWVNNNKKLLNLDEDEESESLQRLAEHFWKNSRKGIPETVMTKICEHCNSTWSEVSKRLVV